MEMFIFAGVVLLFYVGLNWLHEKGQKMPATPDPSGNDNIKRGHSDYM